VAATTISRATWTDGASPTGTLINNARLQADVYDKVDSLVGGAITFGGLVSSEGFGLHAFSAGGTGAQILGVRNTSAGTSNYAMVRVGTDANPELGSITAFASTYTTSGPNIANGTRVISQGAGGLALVASHASGAIKFYAGGTTEWARVETTGELLVADGGGVSTPGVAFLSDPDTGLWRENADQIHLVVGGVSALRITESGGNITFDTSAATGKWSSSVIPSADDTYDLGTTSLAWNQLFLANGTYTDPSIACANDPDTGIYFNGTAGVVITSSGNAIFTATGGGAAGTSVTTWHTLASGTGNVYGPGLVVGRNSSGSGAAGWLSFLSRNGTQGYLYMDDSYVFRYNISSDGPPTENNAGTHTGTVVGTQTSCLASTDLIGAYTDDDASLALITDTPLYRWTYKDGRFAESEFMGVVTDYSPAFGMDAGRSLNVPSGIGHLMAAVKALTRRVAALEA